MLIVLGSRRGVDDSAVIVVPAFVIVYNLPESSLFLCLTASTE